MRDVYGSAREEDVKLRNALNLAFLDALRRACEHQSRHGQLSSSVQLAPGSVPTEITKERQKSELQRLDSGSRAPCSCNSQDHQRNGVNEAETSFRVSNSAESKVEGQQKRKRLQRKTDEQTNQENEAVFVN